jgi:hypothetical protein
MSFHHSSGYYVYIVLIIVSILVGYSGFFVLKKNLKFRQSDVMGNYGGVLVIVVAVIVFLYSIVHVFVHA